MRPRTRKFAYGLVLLVSAATLVAAAAADSRIAEAAKKRDKDALRLLVKQRADVNTPALDGATALHWAAHWGDVEMTDLLIRAGADVNRKDDLGVTPLVLASVTSQTAVVERLLAAGADPNLAGATGETPFMSAARSGNVDVVKTLLFKGANINAKEPTRGQTGLMWAAAEGHSAVVRALVEAGADVNMKSTSGYSPLLFAARKGDVETTKILLAGGARINDTAIDGTSPLLMAVIRGYTDYAEFLMDQGANVNIIDAGYTPLHWVTGAWDTELTVQTGIKADSSEWNVIGGYHEPLKLEFAKKLVARGADVNAKLLKNPGRIGGGGYANVGGTANFGNNNAGGREGVGPLAGATPLYLAAESTDADLMRFLKEAGADPALTPRNNNTLLMAAVGIGRVAGTSRSTTEEVMETAKLAIEWGSDVNAANDAGDTALHSAAYWGDNAIVQYLVDKGANVDPKNKLGNTPYIVAAGQGPRVAGANPHNPATAELLGKLGANTNTSCEWPCLKYPIK
jgi:ankyrin repeat protein